MGDIWGNYDSGLSTCAKDCLGYVITNPADLYKVLEMPDNAARVGGGLPGLTVGISALAQAARGIDCVDGLYAWRQETGGNAGVRFCE